MADQRPISEITASAARLPERPQDVEANQSLRTPYSWPLMIGRVFLYLALGFGFEALVIACWNGLLVVLYGSLDEGLKRLSWRGVSAVLSVVHFATLSSSFVGGFVGPLWLGRLPCHRFTTLASSALGAIIGTAATVGLTFFALWLCEMAGIVRQELYGVIFGSLAIGALMGIVGGWLGSRIALRWERSLKTPSPLASTHPR